MEPTKTELPSFIRKTTKADEQIRLMLVGPAGYGKTTAACTFPNPIVFDWDNNIPNEIKRAGVHTVDFWDQEYVKTNYSGPPAKAKYPLNFQVEVMTKQAVTWGRDVTIIDDSLSMMVDQLMKEIKETDAKEIEKNSYHLWGEFANRLTAYFTFIKSLKCNYVLITHEDQVRDNETNRLLARRWLLDGKKFTPRMASFFNNIFRQIRVPTNSKKAGIGAQKFDEKEEADYEYYWQVKSDDKFTDARTTIKTKRMYVDPTYESFKQQ